MDSLQLFRQRIAWTRNWLDNNKQTTSPEEDFEVIEQNNDAGSDYGVRSISSRESSHKAQHAGSFYACGRASYGDSDSNDAASEAVEAIGDHESVPKLCRNSADASPPTPDQRALAAHSSCGSNCSECMWNDFCSHCGFRDCIDGWSYASTSSSFWFEEEIEREDNTSAEGIAYELAGRQFENTFRDFRSPAKARRRKRTEREKYWNYRAVKPGWLDTEQYEHDSYRITRIPRELPADSKVVTITKKMMYEEAQRYPRPPTYHRSKRLSKRYSPWSTRYEKRMEERKHARVALAEEVEHAEFVNGLACSTKYPIDLWDLYWVKLFWTSGACRRCGTLGGQCSDPDPFDDDPHGVGDFVSQKTELGEVAVESEWCTGAERSEVNDSDAEKSEGELATEIARAAGAAQCLRDVVRSDPETSPSLEHWDSEHSCWDWEECDSPLVD